MKLTGALILATLLAACGGEDVLVFDAVPAAGGSGGGGVGSLPPFELPLALPLPLEPVPAAGGGACPVVVVVVVVGGGGGSSGVVV